MEIEDLLHRYRTLVDPYAAARAKRTYIEEYKKSLIAMLMKKAALEGHGSAAAQEREALASSEYQAQLTALEEAVEQEEKLRYHIKQTEMEIEVWRSLQANERFERKSYGA